VSYVKEQGLDTEFILETHVHADHLTASQYLKMKLGGGGGGGGGGPKVCIGEHISAVQRHFAAYFGLVDFPTDGFASPPTPLLNLNIPRSSYPAWVRGWWTYRLFSFCFRSQFDRLFKEGDTFDIGTIKCKVMHTPGHTPACLTYVIGGALFCGDTTFMPDMGSARCDFPGGSAETLWNSVSPTSVPVF